MVVVIVNYEMLLSLSPELDVVVGERYESALAIVRYQP